jgi:hypothetical protein
MDKLSRNCIFLDEIAIVRGGHLVQVSKNYEDTWIIKNVEGIEANGPKSKLSYASQQKGLSQICLEAN